MNNENDYNFIPYGYDKEIANDLLNEKEELNISELTRRYFYMDFKQTSNESGIYNPLAIYPTYLDQRMQAQKSCFTIFGNKVNGLLSNNTDNSMFLDKIVIPYEFKYHMLNELRILGIDTTSIYPDLDGLGKSISLQFESSFRDNTETLEHVLLKSGTIVPTGNNETK